MIANRNWKGGKVYWDDAIGNCDAIVYRGSLMGKSQSQIIAEEEWAHRIDDLRCDGSGCDGVIQ